MVTKKPKGLGRGLEALLGPKVEEKVEQAQAVQAGLPSALPLTELVPGMYQPRTRMDEGALYELAESIKAQGIMQPILVRRLTGGDNAGKYEIIAGERRFRASRLAGLDAVPVLVRDVPDEAAAAMALIENIQREDLNPLEEAQGLQRLVREFGLTHEQAAQAVGRSRSAASNLLRLLNLAEQIPGWSPIARRRLPFPSVLVGSQDDPYCGFDRAQHLAQAWGARFIDAGERGHINAESGLADWPEGHHLLHTLLKD